jgi:GntR family trehalose operon transcriptional repressor
MKTRYDAIYHDIRESIENGAFPYQSFLPSESELVLSFACSHNTLRRAIGLLREQGYVQPVHGKGVRVVYQEQGRATFTIGDIESYKEASARAHLDTVTDVVELSPLVATAKLARRTGFEEGCDLTAIERVRVIGGERLILDRNLFRASSVPDLTREIAAASVYDYMEDELGITIAMSKRTITVEHATKHDSVELDLDGFDCLAVMTSQTFDAKGILIEYTESRHRPDHFCFRDTAVRQAV